MHTVVAGLGKSGTTALLYAIRAGMPPGTRCLFEPTSYRGVAAPHVLAKILAQRGVDWSSFRGFDRKVFIVRDPRDQLVSFVLYAIYHHSKPVTAAEAGGLIDLLECKEAGSREVPFWRISEAIERITGADHRADLRERHALCGRNLQEDPGFFQVRYEDFIHGRTAALADYLGFPLPPRVEVPTALRRVERTRGSGDWRNWFTPEDVDYFRPELSGVMRTFGFEDTWDLPPSPSVAPEHGSRYVRMIIDAQRERTRWRSQWKRGWRKVASWASERYLSP